MPRVENAYSIKVTGLVQGVGFRPFVLGLANRFNLVGRVLNAGGEVHIELLSTPAELTVFLDRLQAEKPAPARLGSIAVRNLTPTDEKYQALLKYKTFQIEPSATAAIDTPFLPADRVTCPACLTDLKNPRDPRYRYPFISCTVCGPRYSVMQSLPYDRERTTMQAFPLCSSCKQDYLKSSRRCHAQTLACSRCGPRLFLFEGQGIELAAGQATALPDTAADRLAGDSTCVCRAEAEDALQLAIAYVKAGFVVAVKGIAGYQFICRADSEQAVERLRQLKNREAKPFAVMFRDLRLLQDYQLVTAAEEQALLAPAGPIVLLRRQPPKKNVPLVDRAAGDGWIASGVCGNSPYIGAFLPSSGLHQLLLDELGIAVVTSGNKSESPLIIDDREMLACLAKEPNLKAVLTHDRAIVTPLDDSVGFVEGGRFHLIRRARGYVPAPVRFQTAVKNGKKKLAGGGVEQSAGKDVLTRLGEELCATKVPIEQAVGDNKITCGALLACGADLKATTGLLRDETLYLTQPAGDLIQTANVHFWDRSRDHLAELLAFEPEAVLIDQHPAYQSRRRIESDQFWSGLPRLEIQHHHAHIASVMAEHNLDLCLGFAFDGTGYGVDNSIWGGEVLLCRGYECLRLGSLKPITALGGDNMARDAGLMFYNYLLSDGCKCFPENLPAMVTEQVLPATVDLWRQARRAGWPAVLTSSAGRLFDAAAFVLGLGRFNRYEGDLPSQLEGLALQVEGTEQLSEWEHLYADGEITGSGTAGCGAGGRREAKHLPFCLDPLKLLAALCRGVCSGLDRAFLARCFHEALADWIVSVCRKLSLLLKCKMPVALSGGCFNNRLLLQLVESKLRREHFSVYSNEQVPAGDGGLALGQAYLGRLYFSKNNGV